MIKAAVIHIDRRDLIKSRSAEAQLEEAIGLAEAIHLDVAYQQTVPIQKGKISPSTLMHKGNVELVEQAVRSMDIKLVIMNAMLTPIQHRNLERLWKCKVIDRTGLILEIFGARAKTAEGRVQVELAALKHQRSRLVRSWTHLERQRGGFGFTGGPGEKQIELDRRLIDSRILKLEKELEKIKRTRALHRSARKRNEIPIVALVGYTNAGKSTLFNRLTQSHVLATDMLFATLDPSMRPIKLPSGKTVILSDTVGFIAELPTQLIAAFRATLEEVCNADIILHVRDAVHPDAVAQSHDVHQVLKELELDLDHDQGETPVVVEVFNKIDLFEDEIKIILQKKLKRKPQAVAISAYTGESTEILLQLLGRIVNKQGRVKTIKIPSERSDVLAWCYRQGVILTREDRGDKIRLCLRLKKDEAQMLRKMIEEKVLI